MIKLAGNIGSLVKEAAKTDKREQLIPETKSKHIATPTKDHPKP